MSDQPERSLFSKLREAIGVQVFARFLTAAIGAMVGVAITQGINIKHAVTEFPKVEETVNRHTDTLAEHRKEFDGLHAAVKNLSYAIQRDTNQFQEYAWMQYLHDTSVDGRLNVVNRNAVSFSRDMKSFRDYLSTRKKQ